MLDTKTKHDETIAPIASGDGRRGRDRQTRRVVFGLTGLLGAVWAVVIASRFSGIIPG